VRPHDRSEVELGVSGFPQQEVTETLFAASADQQIHVRAVKPLRETNTIGKSAHCLPGLEQGVPARIVDRQPHMQSPASACETLSFLNCPASAGGDAIAAPDHGKPDAFPRTGLQLTAQVKFEQ